MDPAHLRELERVEREYWWNVAKRAMACELLGRFAPPPGSLVEAGIGAGGNLAAFRAMGYEVLGLDALETAIARCRRMGLASRRHDVQERWPIAEGSAQAVVMLDVLEHVALPVVALEHARLCLRTSGRLLLTVPANPGLMGPWDEGLGHRRRYSRTRLVAEARDAGLEPVWVSHWNSFTLLPALLVRTWERYRGRRRGAEFPRVPASVNHILGLFAGAERALMRSATVPAGMSIVGVFRP